jgi:hypothetical protein
MPRHQVVMRALTHGKGCLYGMESEVYDSKKKGGEKSMGDGNVCLPQ